MTQLSWRDKQKQFLINKIEFEQDIRILNWIDDSLSTYFQGDVSYFKPHVPETINIDDAEQALLIFNSEISTSDLENILNSIIKIPRICIAINKFLIIPNKTFDCNSNYDVALFEFVQSIFANKDIDYYYNKNIKDTNFNFASPTTQFFI
jgi:hypothetical protein